MTESDVIKYKRLIMEQLWKNPDIVTFINNPNIDVEAPDEMINVNLFSYIRIPNTTTTVKNYICFDYNSRIHPRNQVLKEITINVVVICHEDDIKTKLGNRHDILGGIVIDAFNWSKFLGFELKLVIDDESIMEKDYHVRTLQFKNTSQNDIENRMMFNNEQ